MSTGMGDVCTDEYLHADGAGEFVEHVFSGGGALGLDGFGE